MSLNMYLGEVKTQSKSMNAFCVATIQGMEQVINSIDAFVLDAVLQGQTYDSAKAFFVQTFRPLAQGIIYLCEELIRQNDAFPSDFQSQVASTDVIEQEILEQIREIERTKAGIEVISKTLPGMQVMVGIFDAMKRKLQEKLEHLHEFNYTSSSNYDTALQLAASIAQGLAEVQSGEGFSAASGTFSTQGLNMDWTASIQKITEDKARKADNTIKEGEMCGKLTPKSDLEEAWDEFKSDVGDLISKSDLEEAWDEFKSDVGDVFQGAGEFLQGAGSAVAEDFIGLTPPDNDKLESQETYQAGRFTGHVLSTVGSIVEIFEGFSVIGGSNFLTMVAEVGTGGLASPIVLPLNAAATAAGIGAVAHGGVVWHKSIQNAQDTLQKFQSSPSSGGRVNKVKENGKLDKEGTATKGRDNTSKKTSGLNFGSTEKLEGHFKKHGGEFGGAYSNMNEYLAGANDVIKNGTKVQYNYKLKDGTIELRTGYVKFMKNSSLTNPNGVPIKSYAKFEFVGTNNFGEITTYHVESGKTFWKMMNNGKNIPVINPVE